MHLLAELLLLVGVDPVSKLLQRQTGIRKDLSIAVRETVTGNIVFHHNEVTHVKGLCHHIIEFRL